MNTNVSLRNITFVAFDFETTGFSPQSDRIIELAAVKFKNAEVVNTYSSLVNPGIPVPEQSQNVSGITNDMLAGKPAIQDIIADFLAFLGDSVLIAHNASFDMSFLREAVMRSGLSAPQNLVIDSCALARKTFPSLGSYSLQNLVASLRLPANTAHRALDDSMQCMRVFTACCEELSFMGDLDLKEVLT